LELFTPLTIRRTTAILHLTKGFHALIDVEDWDIVSPLRWQASVVKGRVYAKSGKHYLHRIIMDAAKDRQVDHISGDPLDNRRSNLRPCTNRQNSSNQRSRGGSSKYKGVHWNRKQSVWVASIHANYGTQYIGHFNFEEDAAKAYDTRAREVFGEFARTNFAKA
jgi:hypothetical protein